jgi:16S rRNA (cytosine967-C5)-methyltransferase
LNARDAALLRLDSVALPGWRVGQLARRTRDEREPDDPRDRALAEAIYVQAVKFHLLLRFLVAHYSGRKLAEIDPAVQKVLSVALAQMRLLTRIPPAVVVDEAVEQSKRFRLGKAGGFINAVLRRATREQDVPLPDESDRRRHVEITLSHPWALYRRIESLIGPNKALRLCRRHNAEPPTIVRLMPGRTISDLRRDGLTVSTHQQRGMVVVDGATRADFASWSKAGIAQVQDPTSAAVVDALALSNGQRVLDRCCGVGTKTMQILERVGSESQIVAVDSATERLEVLNELLRQRGAGNVSTHAGKSLAAAGISGQTFDHILIDAPCSNSGVLMRRAEARYHQSESSLASLRKVQTELLRETLPALAPGGRLVYSTCSIWDEENGGVVRDVLKGVEGFRLVSVETTLPSLVEEARLHHDGGFVAVIERTS